jgi:hypothetical protein
MSNAHERQHVVFAHAVKTDVPDKDHFVVRFLEDFFQMSTRVQVQPSEKLGVHPGDSGGCFEQTVSIRILADSFQDFSNRPLNARQVDFVFRDFRHERFSRQYDV